MGQVWVTVEKFRIVVETFRNRTNIARARCVPVCGYRVGYVGLGLAKLEAEIWLDIEDLRPDL